MGRCQLGERGVSTLYLELHITRSHELCITTTNGSSGIKNTETTLSSHISLHLLDTILEKSITLMKPGNT
jgi:hypothetical protein